MCIISLSSKISTCFPWSVSVALLTLLPSWNQLLTSRQCSPSRENGRVDWGHQAIAIVTENVMGSLGLKTEQNFKSFILKLTCMQSDNGGLMSWGDPAEMWLSFSRKPVFWKPRRGVVSCIRKKMLKGISHAEANQLRLIYAYMYITQCLLNLYLPLEKNRVSS